MAPLAELPEDFFEEVLRQARLSVVVTDPAQRIVWANEAYLAETGRSLAQVLGHRPAEFLTLDMHADEIEHIKAHMREGPPGGEALLRLRTLDGGVAWSRIHISPVCAASGEVRWLVGVHDNISELRRDHDSLTAEATTDFLTGLANRRRFDGDLDLRLSSRAALGGEPFTLMLLDLDRFKLVNDRHGHPVGDEVLRLTGRVLEGACRQSDRAYRLGGDEFALLLEADAEGASQAASRMADGIRQTVLAELDLNVRASCGVATWPQDGADAHSLYRRADTGLYVAKHEASAGPSAATNPG